VKFNFAPRLSVCDPAFFLGFYLKVKVCLHAPKHYDRNKQQLTKNKPQTNHHTLTPGHEKVATFQ
jgi:hypothetical protein